MSSFWCLVKSKGKSIHFRGRNFVKMFLSPTEMESNLKEKSLLPAATQNKQKLGSKFFPLRVGPFSEGDKIQFDKIASFETVSICLLLNVLMVSSFIPVDQYRYFCKQCRSRLRAVSSTYTLYPILLLIFDEIPIRNNECVQIQGWKSPCQKLAGERVKQLQLFWRFASYF